MNLPYEIPADKLWAVIEITTQDKTFACVVPTLWVLECRVVEDEDGVFKQAVCLYPKEEKKYSEFVEKRRKPNTESGLWETYNAVILKLCSLVQSELSSSEAGERTSGKRRILPRVVFDPSSEQKERKRKKANILSDDDSSSSSDDLPILPTKIAIEETSRKSGAIEDIAESEPEQEVRDDSKRDDSKRDDSKRDDLLDDSGTISARAREESTTVAAQAKAALAREHSVSELFKVPERSSPSSNQTGSTPPPLTNKSVTPPQPSNQLLTPNNTVTSTPKRLTPRKTPKKTGPAFSPNRSRLNNHSSFSRELAAMNKTLNSVNLKVHQILFYLCPELEMSKAMESSDKSVPALSLSNEEDEEKCLEFIKERRNSAVLVKHLSSYGSSVGRKETVLGIMRKLLSNDLSCTYNFQGRHRSNVEGPPKRAFGTSQFHPIVVAAVKKYVEKLGPSASFTAEEKDINMDIKGWLKDGPNRVKQQKKKNGE